MRIGWYLESVVLWKERVCFVSTRCFQCGFHFFVEYVAETLIKQERKDKLLVVAGVDRPTKKRRRAPKIGFELLLGDALAHVILSSPIVQTRKSQIRVG